MYPEGYPDFPMAQLLESRRAEQRVTVSCLVSDLRFEWRLEPAGQGTRITVDVEIPDAEAHRLEAQREVISRSLERLAGAAGGAPPGGVKNPPTLPGPGGRDESSPL